jgi:metallo-beta-lactamase family protein
MATDATHLYCAYSEDHQLSRNACVELCRVPHYISKVEQSKALNANRFPMVILAGSGMITGGRILHHLKAFGPDPRNAIVLAGHQAQGTLGAALLDGARTLRVFGEEVPIHAEVIHMDGMSAHADYEDLSRWLESLESSPRQVLINHGDPEASSALADHLKSRFGWDCTVARPEMVVPIDVAMVKGAQ